MQKTISTGQQPVYPDIGQLKQDILECARREGFQKETDALLRMLEKPQQETEVDLILREINAPQSPEDDSLLPTRDGEQTASSGKPARHLVMAVMLFVFSILLISAAVVISLGAGGNSAEPIPSEPVSLCDTGSDGGYMLGIDGESLTVFYNVPFPIRSTSCLNMTGNCFWPASHCLTKMLFARRLKTTPPKLESYCLFDQLSFRLCCAPVRREPSGYRQSIRQDLPQPNFQVLHPIFNQLFSRMR